MSRNGYAGTGPYIYDEYVAGQYTTFVRNENYWGEQPYYDKIVAKYIPDNASRVQALKTGEIDLIYGSAELSYEDYNQATAIDGIEGKFAPSGSTVRNIILNFNGNLSDLSVRQALAYAIDKEAISEGLTYGYEPVANTIVPDGTPYSDICGTEDYSYNVDRANQLLDEAGWIMNQSTGIREKNGTPLHVVFTCPTDDSTIGSIATLFQSQLAEVGIGALFLILNGLMEGIKGQDILFAFLLLLAGVIGKIVCSYISDFSQTRVGYFMCADKRIHIGDRMKYMPMGYFNSHSLGNLTSTVTTTISDVENNAPSVLIGKPDATHEEVVRAAKSACCHDFIMALPNGYDTVIGESGATLSGGEKQRISIARAILKDTPIIILDEATSSVDPENEAELQQAIEKLTEDKTVIIIAHRLKTVRNAQQIVVIANGGITQRGTHQELMTQPGIYADFVNIREKAVNWKISSSKIQQ